MTHRLVGYEPYKGPIAGRIAGSIIAMAAGTVTPYQLDKLQDRGKFFAEPGQEVYGGMVVGEHTRPTDLVVNMTETKKLTNMRASGTDDNVRIAPPVKLSLEESMEYIQKDEYVEITPNALRLRKIYLDENERKRMASSMGLA
jgi:GTP-binding protein